MMKNFPQLILKSGEGRRVERGHLWVFSNEVAQLNETHGGDEVSVFSARGRFLGNALLSPSALIRARIYARQPVSCDAEFISARLTDALNYRRAISYERQSFRLCHSEADFLPGLVVDVYGTQAVIQISTKAMDDRRPLILNALKKVMSPSCIYERSDVPIRELEGLPSVKGLLFGNLTSPVAVEENGMMLLVDIAEGQKTGYFLDMVENRRRLAHCFKGRHVLDVFCYVGAWALCSVAHGAADAIGVDSSAPAIVLARRSAEKNALAENCRFLETDAFDFLKGAHERGEIFDFIVVDPPPFARRKKDVKSALAAYRDINLRAMRLLAPGGILATASCSHNVTPEDFLQALTLAGRDARVDMRLFFTGAQSPDHPIHCATPETAYLNFFAFMRM